MKETSLIKPSMDVFLTSDAARMLAAVRRLVPKKGGRGFLLGHRRGNRVYVEAVLPSPSSAWPSLRSFYEMDAGLGRKIVGFFLIGAPAAARAPLLRPFGTGKVLVEIPLPGGKKRPPAGSLIDYHDRFLFKKIRVVVERPVGRPEGKRP